MTKIFKGCEVVYPSELGEEEFLPQASATTTYYPLSHQDFYRNTYTVLKEIGINIATTSFGLTPKRDRMFMWLETDAQVNGLPLCIGGRNSYDKSMSAGLCVGTKIMVCSNKVLASYENGGVVSRKHTSAENIDELSKEFRELLDFQVEGMDNMFYRLEGAKTSYIANSTAKWKLVDLVLANIIRPTDIPLIWDEYKNPKHEEFKQYDETDYGFLMAATEVFKLHKGADYQIKAYDGVAKALGL